MFLMDSTYMGGLVRRYKTQEIQNLFGFKFYIFYWVFLQMSTNAAKIEQEQLGTSIFNIDIVKNSILLFSERKCAVHTKIVRYIIT